jgi:purine-nucleoside phosphorylase
MIAGLREFQAEWGIVLGSGLASLAQRVQIAGRAPYADVPELPVSRVAGHAGELIWGTLGGSRVLIASGRVHLYEGRSAAEVTAMVRWLAECGVRRLVLTNAAGSLNEAHPPGGWMAITDHLNLTGTSPLIGGANFHAMSGIYSRGLRERFAAAAAAERMPLYEGVYAGVIGPQYETPAEIRMLQRLGADAVGMSTVLEAIQAHALGMEVAGFSCLTNWAAGLSAEPLSHAAVLAAGREAAESFCRLLERAMA